MNAPSSHRLMEVISLAQATLERLREEDGLVLETEAELRFALTDEGVSVDDVLSRLGRAALDAKAYGEAVDARIAALQLRRARFQGQEERWRQTLFQALQALGLSSFGSAEFSATVSKGKAKVMVTDVDALPPTCVRLKREPDRKAIAEWLEDGGLLAGATLSNAEPFLTIRCK